MSKKFSDPLLGTFLFENRCFWPKSGLQNFFDMYTTIFQSDFWIFPMFLGVSRSFKKNFFAQKYVSNFPLLLSRDRQGFLKVIFPEWILKNG